MVPCLSVEPPTEAYTTGHLARSAGGESISYSTETSVTFIVLYFHIWNNNLFAYKSSNNIHHFWMAISGKQLDKATVCVCVSNSSLFINHFIKGRPLCRHLIPVYQLHTDRSISIKKGEKL